MIIFICLFLTAAQQSVDGTVNVSDGDTLTVLVDSQEIKIRLDGIDAPESKQPFGDKSKQALRELTHGKTVTVSISGKDRYGRSIGVVAVDGLNVNETLIERGLAWHYKRFSTSARLAKLEQEAREAKRGLWVDADPVAPWEWREREKANRRK